MQRLGLRLSSFLPRRLVVAGIVLLGVLVALFTASPSLRMGLLNRFAPDSASAADPMVMSPSEVAARASFGVLWPASLPPSMQYAGGDVGPAGSHGPGTGIEKGFFASFTWVASSNGSSSDIHLVEAKELYPLPRGQSVSIRGQTGVRLVVGNESTAGSNGKSEVTIVWHENGLTLTVQGQGISETRVQQVAESLQPLNRPTTVLFLDKSTRQVDGPRAVVGSPNDFPVPSVTQFADLKVYLIRTELGFVALIDDDPHGHHPTAWNPAAQYFISPAHGEEYDWEGNCIGGPCPRGLDRYSVEIDGDAVVINLGQRLPGRPIGDHPHGIASPRPPFVPWGIGG